MKRETSSDLLIYPGRIFMTQFCGGMAKSMISARWGVMRAAVAVA